MQNEDIKAFFERYKSYGDKLKALAPGASTGFGGLFAKVMSDGTLTVRQKELIALGIAVALKCEPCIRLHTQKCLESGASKPEVLEAASVAVMMAGGPAYVHLPMVIETLESLEG